MGGAAVSLTCPGDIFPLFILAFGLAHVQISAGILLLPRKWVFLSLLHYQSANFSFKLFMLLSPLECFGLLRNSLPETPKLSLKFKIPLGQGQNFASLLLKNSKNHLYLVFPASSFISILRPP